MEKINWLEELASRLSYSTGKLWSNGEEILCKSGSDAECIADLLEILYRTQGEDVVVTTGFYDPKEDQNNHELDGHTGWYYVSIQ